MYKDVGIFNRRSKGNESQGGLEFAERNSQRVAKDKVSLWAAALSYYTAFSLAPLLVIAIAISGAVFGEDAVQGQIVGQIQGLVGRQGAEAIQALLRNAYQPGSGGTLTTIVGVGALLIGASGVFGQLQEALNTIWGVKPKPGLNLRSFIRDRFLSFAMVLVIGFFAVSVSSSKHGTSSR